MIFYNKAKQKEHHLQPLLFTNDKLSYKVHDLYNILFLLTNFIKLYFWRVSINKVKILYSSKIWVVIKKHVKFQAYMSVAFRNRNG